MSSMLAKMLHEPATSSYAQIHGGSKASKFLAADGLCETLLYPVIRGTYRYGSRQCACGGTFVPLQTRLSAALLTSTGAQELQDQEMYTRKQECALLLHTPQPAGTLSSVAFQLVL